jgi:hypothetical protein
MRAAKKPRTSGACEPLDGWQPTNPASVSAACAASCKSVLSYRIIDGELSDGAKKTENVYACAQSSS